MEDELADRQAEQQVETVEAMLEGIEVIQAEDAGSPDDSRILGAWELRFRGFLIDWI